MADVAAHHNQATIKDSRPTVFDLLAQDSLLSTLRPAFNFSLRTVANHYPEKLSAIIRYSDEMFYFVLTLVESYHIWTKHASFSEHFYNLKRISSQRQSINVQEKLRWRTIILQKIGSLACQTFLPYVKTKLERLYVKFREEMTTFDDKTSGNGRIDKERCSKLYLKLYPYFYCALEGSALVTLICYVLNMISFHSITNGLLGIKLTYSTTDGNFIPKSNKQSTTNNEDGIYLYSIRVLKYLLSSISIFTEFLLPAGVFFLRFIELWYSTNTTYQDERPFSPIQPPLKSCPVAQNGSRLSIQSSHCPLCQKSLTSPTVLSISGYVFCYSCIYKYVDAHRSCPFTFLQCAPEQLVKLYI